MNARRLALAGSLAAIVALATAYLRIPYPMAAGYAHLGDGPVVLCGLLLGRFGALPAALGSAMADLLSGFPAYAPITALVKGAMAYIAAKWVAPERGIVRSLPAMLAAFAFMVGAYYLADALIYGSFEVAAASAVGNGLQAGFGIAVSSALAKVAPALKRALKRD